MFLIFDILLTKNNVYYIITGSISDGGVWSNSTFADALDHGETKLPPLKMLPGSHIKFPHVFVADEAFPLKSYFMRPYPRNALQDKQ